MPHLLIFGLGYTASLLSRRLAAQGWTVESTGRLGTMAFHDAQAVHSAIARAGHILSSVPPQDEQDPVLGAYSDALSNCDAAWMGYLSSTGVYGDTGGAGVDETAPIGMGRRNARAAADAAWQALERPTHIFRLPGIYGPGRSALERIREGRARRIDDAAQVFSRVHVEDIVSGVITGMAGPAGVYNLADDLPCPQNQVIEFGCDLLGCTPPQMQTLEEAGLSPMARAFYAENRRVANLKAKRLLGWQPRYPDYRAGLAACLAAETLA